MSHSWIVTQPIGCDSCLTERPGRRSRAFGIGDEGDPVLVICEDCQPLDAFYQAFPEAMDL